MGCGGCGHRYNPAGTSPSVNRVVLPAGRVRGRYRIQRVVPPRTVQPVVLATKNKVTK